MIVIAKGAIALGKSCKEKKEEHKKSKELDVRVERIRKKFFFKEELKDNSHSTGNNSRLETTSGVKGAVGKGVQSKDEEDWHELTNTDMKQL